MYSTIGESGDYEKARVKILYRGCMLCKHKVTTNSSIDERDGSTTNL